MPDEITTFHHIEIGIGSIDGPDRHTNQIISGVIVRRIVIQTETDRLNDGPEVVRPEESRHLPIDTRIVEEVVIRVGIAQIVTMTETVADPDRRLQDGGQIVDIHDHDPKAVHRQNEPPMILMNRLHPGNYQNHQKIQFHRATIQMKITSKNRMQKLLAQLQNPVNHPKNRQAHHRVVQVAAVAAANQIPTVTMIEKQLHEIMASLPLVAKKLQSIKTNWQNKCLPPCRRKRPQPCQHYHRNRKRN